jgi:hypothetical protein
MMLNLEVTASAPDALEARPTSPALPLENDPIGYHSRQREAAKTGQSPEAEAFAQMCLDYLSAPGIIHLHLEFLILIPFYSNLC